MESEQITRVLIVANRTASTRRLIEAVRRRAQASRCEFALLIPDVTDRKAADWTLETAQQLMRPAARGEVEGLVGGPDPFESVKEAVNEGKFDEIIIATLPKRMSTWLRRDLIRRIDGLGFPGDRHRPGPSQGPRRGRRLHRYCVKKRSARSQSYLLRRGAHMFPLDSE
jgi:hypothetical protein